jgi:hypothetical protein
MHFDRKVVRVEAIGASPDTLERENSQTGEASSCR